MRRDNALRSFSQTAWSHPGCSRRHLAHDSYLTDGVRLIRIVSLADSGFSRLAWIEDCLTLERWARSANPRGPDADRPPRIDVDRRLIEHEHFGLPEQRRGKRCE